MQVDPMTYQSTEPDIFGGGDAVQGPGFTIDAIATGKPGAISIHRFLRGYSMTMAISPISMVTRRTSFTSFFRA